MLGGCRSSKILSTHWVLSSTEDGVSSHPNCIFSLTDQLRYTHLWAIIGCTSEEWQAAWPQLIRDVPRILEAAKVPVCYSWKDGGKAKDFTDPCLANTSDGIHFNGIDEDGCEPFILEEFEDEYNFCKTSQRPYDLPVATILLRAYTLAPSCFYLR